MWKPTSPNEELLDPLFIEEITQLMAGGTQELPGYEDGGVILGEGGNVGQELLNTVFGIKPLTHRGGIPYLKKTQKSNYTTIIL